MKITLKALMRKIEAAQAAGERSPVLRISDVVPGLEWAVFRSRGSPGHRFWDPIWITDSWQLALDMNVALTFAADGVPNAAAYKAERVQTDGPEHRWWQGSMRTLRLRQGELNPREGGHYADVRWCEQFASDHSTTPRYYSTREIGSILPASAIRPATLRVGCRRGKVPGARFNNAIRMYEATREAWIKYVGHKLEEADWTQLSR